MRSRAVLVVLLLLALLVRLPSLIFYFPQSNDVREYSAWAHSIREDGLIRIYDNPSVDYPPLLIYVLDAAARIERQFNILAPDPASNTTLGGLFMRIAAVVADLLTASLIAAALWSRSTRAALLAFSLYAFNPAVLYVSAVWGQTDSVYTLFLVASLLALERRALLPAWLLYALAVATKLQAFALAPLLIAWTLAHHGWKSFTLGLASSLAALTLICSPWLLTGRADLILRIYTTPTEGRTVVSAYNLWYLLAGGITTTSSSATPFGPPLTYQAIGVILFATLSALIIFLALRGSASLPLTAAALSLLLFVVMVDMHERHAFPAIAFLLWAAADRSTRASAPLAPSSPTPTRAPLLWWAYALLTLTVLYNLVTIYPYYIFQFAFGNGILVEDPASPRFILIKALSYAAAAISILLLVALIWLLGRPPLPRPAPSTSTQYAAGE